MFLARIIPVLFAVLECAHATTCYDNYNRFYCANGCCGINDDYCCDVTTYTGWGTGSIAGTTVGLICFFLFVAFVVVCCRRRRRLRPVLVQQQNTAGVTVVQSNSSQQMNSVAANVAPAYPQYPQYPQPGYPQPGYPQPGYPTGHAQPPPYTGK